MKLINFFNVVVTITSPTTCEKPNVIQDDGKLVPIIVEHDPSFSNN